MTQRAKVSTVNAAHRFDARVSEIASRRCGRVCSQPSSPHPTAPPGRFGDLALHGAVKCRSILIPVEDQWILFDQYDRTRSPKATIFAVPRNRTSRSPAKASSSAAALVRITSPTPWRADLSSVETAYGTPWIESPSPDLPVGRDRHECRAVHDGLDIGQHTRRGSAAPPLFWAHRAGRPPSQRVAVKTTFAIPFGVESRSWS